MNIQNFVIQKVRILQYINKLLVVKRFSLIFNFNAVGFNICVCEISQLWFYHFIIYIFSDIISKDNLHST